MKDFESKKRILIDLFNDLSSQVGILHRCQLDVLLKYGRAPSQVGKFSPISRFLLNRGKFFREIRLISGNVFAKLGKSALIPFF